MVKWWALFYLLGTFVSGEYRDTLWLLIPVSALYCLVNRSGLESHKSLLSTEAGLRPGHLFLLASLTSILFYSAAIPEVQLRKIQGNTEIRKNAEDLSAETYPVRLLITAAAKTRNIISDRIDSGNLSERSRSMAKAFLLAKRRELSPDVRYSYIYLGIAHFMALSGLHLGILILPVSILLSYAGFGRWPAGILIAILIIFYSAVAGFPPSLLRAASLFIAALLLGVLNTRAALTESLLAGALGLLTARPGLILNTGFQLSFMAVSGIAMLGLPAMKIAKQYLGRIRAGRAIELLFAPLIITLSVNLFLLPIILKIYGRFPLISPLVNLIMVLPFSIFLYSIAIYLVVPFCFIRELLAIPANLFSRFLCSVPELISCRYIPAVYLNDLQQMIYYAALLILVISLNARFSHRGKMALAGVFMVLVSLVLPGPGMLPDGNKVIYTDFGEPMWKERIRYSNCSGGILTIRGGMGEYRSINCLVKLHSVGIGRVENMVICSSELNPWNGIEILIKRLKVKRIICSHYLYISEGARLECLLSGGITVIAVQAGTSIDIGDLTIEILKPEFPPETGSDIDSDDLLLTYYLIIRE
ncbi:MAG: hypothetical protein GF417_03880 [Candidatus Latescibacteria bacterium]|nr:hypothetical protein [bacterium]MBD3423565.1 hypothetical protein [Candidatus Latescibacterota bacterium]